MKVSKIGILNVFLHSKCSSRHLYNGGCCIIKNNVSKKWEEERKSIRCWSV